MTLRIISPRAHAISDYILATLLIATPFMINLLNISPWVHWLSIMVGIVLAGYSLITNYTLSLYPGIPYNRHLNLDAIMSFIFFILAIIQHNNEIAFVYCCTSSGAIAALTALSTPKSSTIG